MCKTDTRYCNQNYKTTSDYATSGFAELRYIAPWTDWRLLPFWQLFCDFWPILILGQFVITPYSDIFDWSSGLGGDNSGQTYRHSHSVHSENISIDDIDFHF